MKRFVKFTLISGIFLFGNVVVCVGQTSHDTNSTTFVGTGRDLSAQKSDETDNRVATDKSRLVPTSGHIDTLKNTENDDAGETIIRTDNPRVVPTGDRGNVLKNTGNNSIEETMIQTDKSRLVPTGGRVNVLENAKDAKSTGSNRHDVLDPDMDFSYPGVILQSDTVVGSLPGKLSVTPTGSSSYTVPIAVSPGTAGITPQLSVTYNSQNQNGLLGMGFNLEGLTSVVRCPSNLAQNGEIHGVDFTDRDRFCFNGDQLIAVRGEYGADGTEYRTYHDSQTRIISYGRQGNGPMSFKVWTKGGQVGEYGTTDDSRVKAQGKETAAMWALHRLKDTMGNYEDVTYEKDDVTEGTFYPVKIQYTGNEKTGMTPYNEVKMLYETRPDTQLRYQAGSKSTLTKRLNELQILTEGQLTYDYYFKYQPSADTNRSLLSSLQECDGNLRCMKPTTFEWKANKTYDWETKDSFIPPAAATQNRGGSCVDNRDNGVEFIDLLGRGVPDIIQYSAWGDKTAWKNAGDHWDKLDQYLPPVPLTVDNGEDNGVRFVDLQGLGKLNLVQCRENNGCDTWANFNGGWKRTAELIPPLNLKMPIPIVTADHKDLGVRFVDLTGRGREDFIANDQAYFNQGDHWNPAPNYHLPQGLTVVTGDFKDNGVRFINVSGSGLPDIVSDDGIWLNTGKGWEKADYSLPVKLTSHDHKDNGVRFVSLLGDGLLDIVQYSEWGERGAWFNTGHGFVPAPSSYYPPESMTESYKLGACAYDNQDTGVRFTDFDGSGIEGQITRSGFWVNWFGWKKVREALPNVVMDGSPNPTQLLDVLGTGVTAVLENGASNPHQGGSSVKAAWIPKAGKTDLLEKIKDGLGTHSAITYQPITNPSVYTPDTDGQYPNIDFNGPLYVVSQTTGDTDNSDPLSIQRLQAQGENGEGQQVTDYRYKGAKINRLGQGFLGFREMTTIDETTGLRETSTFSQDTANQTIGRLLKRETRTKEGVLLVEHQNTWVTESIKTGEPGSTYYRVWLKKQEKHSNDLAGQTKSAETTNTTIDEWGNPTLVVQTAEDVRGTYKTTTKNTYKNDLDRWFIGEVTRTEVTMSRTGSPDITRVSSFAYDPENGLLKTEWRDPDDPTYALKTSYEQDPFGNVTDTTVSGSDIKTRTSTQKYDEKGRFVVWEKNASGHISSRTVDVRFGLSFIETDVNGGMTVYRYDSFGRKQDVIRADGVKYAIRYYWFNPSGINDAQTECLKYAVYITAEQQAGDRPTWIFYDKLNREVAKRTQGADGRPIWEATEYDDLGRTTRKSIPYYDAQPAYYTSIQYDVLGRMERTVKASGQTVLMAYDSAAGNGAFSETVTNANGQKVTRIKNTRDELVESIDADGKRTHYDYDAYGNLAGVTDSAGNVSTMIYDRWGRKTDLNDPDKGHCTYRYDVLGELIEQTDAKGQETWFEYDLLGRMISRTDRAGKSIWVYDTARHGLGKIALVQGVANASGNRARGLDLVRAANDDLVDYQKAYTYDPYSRIETETTTVNGKDYQQKFGYDRYGFMTEETSPSGLVMRHGYNKLGYHVVEYQDGTQKLLWILDTIDAEQRITGYDNANGLRTTLSYDPRTGELLGTRIHVAEPLKFQREMFFGYAGVGVGTGRDLSIRKSDTNRIQTDNARVIPTSVRANSVSPVGTGRDLFVKINDRGANDIETDKSRLVPTSVRANSVSTAGTDRDLSVQHLSQNDDVQMLYYDYDAIGNVKNRNDAVLKTNDHFTYDSLNRIRSWENTTEIMPVGTGRDLSAQNLDMNNHQINLAVRTDKSRLVPASVRANSVSPIVGACRDLSAFPSAEKYDYDEMGNITLKSDLGQYRYSKKNAGPHAVTDIVGLNGNAVASFQYDANGDQIEATVKGQHRIIEYTSFGKPKSVTMNPGTADEATTRFYYNADREEFMRVDQRGSRKTTTLYLGDYEQVFQQDGAKTTLEDKLYFDNVVYRIVQDGASSTVVLNYLGQDALGSVTVITDDQGNVVQRFKYTPFGEQEQVKGESSVITHQGFTGHETIEGMNLIHMSGRLYDPVIGRFLSADPIVQAPENSQSLNRYSYCINNPLRLTDPTGYSWWDDFWDGIGDIIHAVGHGIDEVLRDEHIAPLLNMLANVVAVTFQQYWIPVVLSAAEANAQGAEWDQVLMAAGMTAMEEVAWTATGGTLQAVDAGYFTKVAVHGAVGGTLSGIEGGGFTNGFLSAAVSEGVMGPLNTIDWQGNAVEAIIARTATAGLIGGTIASATGGNFIDGAKTAAMAELYNDIAHDVFLGAAMGGAAGAMAGGEDGAVGGGLAGGPVGAVAGGVGGGALGAITGAMLGAGKALITDTSLMYKSSQGTPSRAKVKKDRQQGPREIKRIDGPEEGVPKSQWHAHGKNGGGLNQDGSIHDSEDPGFSRRALDWLREHGWKV